MEYDQQAATKTAHKKRQLDLKRPLAFIDLETTGLSTLSDRIVEIGVLKIMPDGHKHQFYAKLNPERPISKAAVRVHGITNKEVENRPTFKIIAPRLLHLLADCDLGGFNVVKFDLPVLQEEFRRVGLEFVLANRHVVDVKLRSLCVDTVELADDVKKRADTLLLLEYIDEELAMREQKKLA
jgi:DNA polymerase III epsilon subunit-like protein